MRPSLLLLLSGYLFLSFSSTLLAREIPDYVLDFEYQHAKFDYREYDLFGQIVDSEESDGLQGFEVSLKAKFADGMFGNANYIKLGYELNFGTTVYTGSYLGSPLGYGSLLSRSDNAIEDYSMMLSEEHLGRSYDLWAGVGGGHREWERALSTTQIETYKWWYWNLEAGGKLHLNEQVSLGVAYEYKQAINPQMDADLSSYSFMTFDLGSVKGYALRVPLVYTVNEDLSLYLEYEREVFKIERSNVINGFQEPDSTTKIDKASAGIRFKFIR